MSDPVKDWLRTKRVQIWGSGGWDLTDEYELGLASEWFTRELADFGDHIFYGYGADLFDYFGKTRLTEPPAKGTHEWDLTVPMGPEIDGLPGTGIDHTWTLAREWSET